VCFGVHSSWVTWMSYRSSPMDSTSTSRSPSFCCASWHGSVLVRGFSISSASSSSSVTRTWRRNWLTKEPSSSLEVSATLWTDNFYSMAFMLTARSCRSLLVIAVIWSVSHCTTWVWFFLRCAWVSRCIWAKLQQKCLFLQGAACIHIFQQNCTNSNCLLCHHETASQTSSVCQLSLSRSEHECVMNCSNSNCLHYHRETTSCCQWAVLTDCCGRCGHDDL